jgi:glucose/arabinose dehydrogenase
MAFLTSDRYGPQWRGSLFIGSLKFNQLWRLEMAGTRVVREERLDGVGERVRDVRQGPDGLLYLLTDSPQGRLLRVLPAL